jgi:CBS-domain-containing membrane protein
VTAPDKPLSLTAGDLMTRDVRTVRADTSLADAARQLARWGVRGAPVVNDTGRCVGVLSVSDLARWVAGQSEAGTALPRACAFQEKYREPGGRETVLCLLAEGVCPLQRVREMPDGKLAVVCTEPHCVPTDWQVVELDSAPGTVRDVMTTEVVSVGPDAPVTELAQVMLDRGVHRLLVLDTLGRPVGVVAVDDLLQVLAHPEITTLDTRP